jgi:hypothetical protein
MNTGTTELLIGLGIVVVMMLFFFGLFWLMQRNPAPTQREQDEAERREYAHAERMRSLELGIPLPDESQTQDEEAARLLGLFLGDRTPELAAQVSAAFWAADAANRRALAKLVWGLAVVKGRATDEHVLAVIRSLRPKSESPSQEDGTPSSSTDIKQ